MTSKRNQLNREQFRNISIVFLIIILVCGLFIYLGNKYIDTPKRDAFNARKKLTVGAIPEKDSWGFRGHFNYKYSVNGREFIHDNYSPKVGPWTAFINKKFPVIYDSLYPDDSYLLIFPENFREFGLSFPDSLSWVNTLGFK